MQPAEQTANKNKIRCMVVTRQEDAPVALQSKALVIQPVLEDDREEGQEIVGKTIYQNGTKRLGS